MTSIYKLTVYQIFSIPNDILGKQVEVLNPLSSSARHIVIKELFDTNQKAIDRQAYYTSTYPLATLSFSITQISVG